MLGNAKNSEQAVLGCLVLYPEKFGSIRQIVCADDFAGQYHSAIFKAFEYYHKDGLCADITLLKDYFNKSGEDIDWFYLSSLTEAFVHQSNLIAYCKTVKEESLRRAYNNLLLQAQEDLKQDEFKTVKTKDLVAELMKNAIQIDTFREDKFSMASALEHYKDSLVDKKPLASLGFSALDEITQGGIYRHGLVTIGADSGAGKTVIAVNMAANKSLLGEKILFINLEIPVVDMLEILAAILGDGSIDYQRIIQAAEDDRDALVEFFYSALEKHQIYFARDCYSIEEIIAQMDLHRIDYGVDSVFIDHGQLIKNSEDYSKYVGITKDLKRYVLKYEVPIFLLSQLNDNKEKRADKEPRKADLRGGANLYQDSDIVLFLYRLDPEDKTVYMKISKNRKGAQGEAIYYEIIFDPPTRRCELMRLEKKPVKENEDEKQEPRYIKRKRTKKNNNQYQDDDNY